MFDDSHDNWLSLLPCGRIGFWRPGAMRDYATDRRGDVGSWVREVAMEAGSLWASPGFTRFHWDVALLCSPFEMNWETYKHPTSTVICLTCFCLSDWEVLMRSPACFHMKSQYQKYNILSLLSHHIEDPTGHISHITCYKVGKRSRCRVYCFEKDKMQASAPSSCRQCDGFTHCGSVLPYLHLVFGASAPEFYQANHREQ